MKAFSIIAILVISLFTMNCAVLAIEQPQNATQVQNETKERFMFVQSAHSGSFVPVAGNESLYNLTLMGISPTTIAFSDRPDRIVAQAPMQQFLNGLNFSPNNPPNAAIEIMGGNETEDVAVVELLDPAYDDANQTLRYTARILEQANHSYAEFNERNDKKLPATFGPAALFIDDCPDARYQCRKGNYGPAECGEFTSGCCWRTKSFNCVQCHADEYYNSLCAQKFSNCNTEWVNCDCGVF
jgi:hypothetical protein